MDCARINWRASGRSEGQAQKKRRSRQTIDEPGLRHRLHPGADQRNDLPDEEEPIVAVLKGSEHHRQAGLRAVLNPSA